MTTIVHKDIITKRREVGGSMQARTAATIKLITSMVIFGTIGLFVRHIPLQSSMIALTRGIVGTIFLLSVLLLSKRKPDMRAVRNNILWLFLSGAFLGFNWILLFESYRYTSIAVSTMCYYMAPIFVILVSPILLREKLTARKLLCVFAALVGMIFISGVLSESTPQVSQMKGILLGLSAAVLYASVVICNKKIVGIRAYDKTIFQLLISAIVLTPYCAATFDMPDTQLTATGILLLLFVGIVHTGIAYYLFFGSMEHIKAQSVALISYVDPVVAVVVSVALLSEPFKPTDMLGAVLILGAAAISELPEKRRSNA